jgi:hypothetical protein
MLKPVYIDGHIQLTRMKMSLLIIRIAIISALIHMNVIMNAHNATAVSDPSETPEAESFDHTYTLYGSLLRKYVRDARVDYKGFLSSKAEFEKFLESLGRVREEEYQAWTEPEKLAFWINAYNAFTIEAILENYPISRRFSLIGLFVPSNSILQIKGVWDGLKWKAAGKMLTLGEIEHEILRKEFDEPRIHAAINCASIGCPDLRGEAYIPHRLEEQLSQASAGFINNGVKGLEIDTHDGRIRFSKIFKWFGDDFVDKYGGQYEFEGRSEKENAILNFALIYLADDDKKDFLKRNDFDMGWLGYDWHLNEQQVTGD